MLAMVSTPAKPPRDDKGQRRRHSALAHSVSASSRWAIRRCAVDRVAERFHRERVLGHAGKIEEVRHRPQSRIR